MKPTITILALLGVLGGLAALSTHRAITNCPCCTEEPPCS